MMSFEGERRNEKSGKRKKGKGLERDDGGGGEKRNVTEERSWRIKELEMAGGGLRRGWERSGGEGMVGGEEGSNGKRYREIKRE